jgi:hypothetical protein
MAWQAMILTATDMPPRHTATWLVQTGFGALEVFTERNAPKANIAENVPDMGWRSHSCHRRIRGFAVERKPKAKILTAFRAGERSGVVRNHGNLQRIRPFVRHGGMTAKFSAGEAAASSS